MSLFATFVNGYWVHELSPFLGPHWGNFGIRYYGLAYLLGFVSAWWLLVRYARAERSKLPAERIADFMVAVVFGVLLGGRLGYFILYQPEVFVSDPVEILRVWEGGMASHGGMIGVTLALAWFARKEKIPFRHLSDLVVSTAPLGLFFGRIANFINGELWGKITDFKYAVIFPNSAAPGKPLHLIQPRHPSQLYEAALEGLLLLLLVQWRFWRTDVTRRSPGRLSGEFLIAYAIVRSIGEVFREPDGIVMGLSKGTFYSIFLILAGAALIVASSRKTGKAAGK